MERKTPEAKLLAAQEEIRQLKAEIGRLKSYLESRKESRRYATTTNASG
ncbi:MAG: hypothetical protein WAW90_01485 [Minisyncoccia bacterium]